ncbi:MAG: hypothetical protein ACKO6Q_06180 [Bacteroidota bacterium]
MKKLLGIVGPILILTACGSKTHIPDVSGVQADVSVVRFDESFFQIDTNRLGTEMVALSQAHPVFYAEFMENVLGLPNNDSSASTQENLRFFFRGYRPLFDTLRVEYKKVDDIQRAVQEGIRFVRHYFPNYPTKKNLIFFVGPFDAPGAAVSREGIAIGLQQFAGANFSFYASPQGQELFPSYISRRFERPYIAVNCLKLITKEVCPDTVGTGPLITQMIRRGKEAWLLDRFLPVTADEVKLGYTKAQLAWCKENEALIWSYFLKNVDLQSTDPDVIQNFLGEAPFTTGVDQEHSPGNLGTWVGRQIVQAYMEKNPKTTPADLVRIDPEKILEGATYKPR